MDVVVVVTYAVELGPLVEQQGRGLSKEEYRSSQTRRYTIPTVPNPYHYRGSDTRQLSC